MANSTQQDLELRVSVEIVQPYYSSNGLRVNETVTLKSRDFLEVCKILGKFHDLAESLRQRDENT